MHELGTQIALWAENFQRGVMAVCLWALLALVPAAVAAFGLDVLRRGRFADRIRSMWCESKLWTSVLFACLCVAFKLGATKPNTSYRADPGIGLVAWETESTYGEPYQAGVDPETGEPVMASNVVSFVWMFATTNNVCPTPISYRGSSTNYWVDAVKTTPGWSAQQPVLDHVDGPTNWWSLAQSDYAGYTNALQQATTQWYVGTDLPSVEVTMGELVTIERIEAHSTGFKVVWTVDGSVDFANRRLTRDADDTVTRQLKTYSFDEAVLQVRIAGIRTANRVVSLEGYDGKTTELVVDGFFVNQLSSVYVGITLTNLQEVE